MKIESTTSDKIATEEERLNKSKSDDIPFAVVIKGKYDANGALKSAVAKSLIFQIAKTYKVAIKTIEEANRFGPSIREASLGEGRKISLLVVMTHGRPQWLQLGKSKPWYHRLLSKGEHLYQAKQVLPEDFSYLSPDAKIFLFSCSAGQGIAQAISDASGKKVFAPMGTIYDAATCLQNWPESEIKLLSYDEKNEQHVYLFSPGKQPVLASRIERTSPENKESFSAMADFLKESAAEGDTEAQLKLFSFYIFGLGNCEQSEKEAVRWLSLAAENGNSQAQFVMGIFYWSGQIGFEQSNEKAAEFFKRSASQGNPSALFQLGLFFLHGQCGFSPLDETAVKFFTLAANRRVAQAHYYLGFMYEHGRGIQCSLKRAKDQYKIAEEYGIPEAKARLAALLFQEEQQRLGGYSPVFSAYTFVSELVEVARDAIKCLKNPSNEEHPDLLSALQAV